MPSQNERFDAESTPPETNLRTRMKAGKKRLCRDSESELQLLVLNQLISQVPHLSHCYETFSLIAEERNSIFGKSR